MRIIKIFILIATGLFLNNCANKSHSDTVLGGATGATMCLKYIGDNPYLIARCAVGVNSRNGNNGIINITNSYMVGSLKCNEYDRTVDITSFAGVNRKIEFGIVCQTPGGQWIEKPDGLKPNYVVEGSKRMNIFERNAYIEKYYPNNSSQ